MLTHREKNIFKQDGLSPNRQKAFQFSRKMGTFASRSLDDYLKFLQSIQKVFAVRPSQSITITRLNKL